MVDFDSQIKIKDVRMCSLRSPRPMQSSPRPAEEAATAAYDHYLRLPELSRLCTSRDFPEWKGEPVVKPALQALEITFRFISSRLSGHREWGRRLESLANRQLELVAALCEERQLTDGAPTWRLSGSTGVLKRDRSSQEVWKVPGSSPVVSRTSEESLLPRLAAWERSEEIAGKLQMEIECQMRRSPFTLGLGEPNLSRKPILEYDLVCRPARVHALAIGKNVHGKAAAEEESLHTCQQVMETWVVVGKQLLVLIGESIEGERWGAAAGHCWLVERVWKLLAEIEDLHMQMDPDGMLRLKQELGIKATSGSEAFCFRSRALMEMTRWCSRELKRWVPEILDVEVDPEGGPRVQEAAMELFGSGRKSDEEKVHLLQAFQGIDAAVKKFFFGYRQLIVAVMGSLEAGGGGVGDDDSLKQLFMDPPYFPSLDAAKTFLADFYQRRYSRSRYY